MAGVKSKIEFDMLYSKYACYAMHRNNVPFINRLYVNNAGEELTGCDLIIESNPEFTLPFKSNLNLLPEDSTVAVDANSFNMSPYFLANVSAEQTSNIILKIVKDNKIIKQQSFETQLLPYDIWNGSEGFTESLASFVRPRSLAVSKILKNASDILKSWKTQTEISGYIGSNKNRIREIAAAIYTALQDYEIKCDNLEADYKLLNKIRTIGEILDSGHASIIEMATVYASVLEAAKINPIIAIGKTVFCGFWLEDNCFLESLSDDVSQLKKRMSDGINDIGAVDLINIFMGGKLNFTASQKECLRQLNKEDLIDNIIDIKRCRLVAIRPLPERIQTKTGYDLLSEEETQTAFSPSHIKQPALLNVKTQATKERQWERRLLDLSLRNALLSFKTGKNTAHLMSWDLNETVKNIISAEEFTILEKPKDNLGANITYPSFNSNVNLKPLSELIRLEFKNKRIRSFADEKDLASTLSSLYRRDRTSIEETGASTIFLAAGFLKWQEKYVKNSEKYAPLILLPVTLIKRTGGKGFSLKTREDEFLLNTTLLEFLKQEFNIDIRGLDRINFDEADINNIISTIRHEIINMKDWDIAEDVYLASFSFSRYLMWNDIRHHIEDFKNNKFIKSLVSNKIEINKNELVINEVNPEDFKQTEILTPINADAYQFSAIAAALAGKSFVLHGPPGTGKSQTITNIIANLVANGKTVLFVAEKMAALSVVKKRLDDIGIGDFCLELHSNKAGKVETANRILNTFELKKTESNPSFKSDAQKIEIMRSELNSSINALHKKRALNLSVYEAVIKYLENIAAPDNMNIESVFYDNLTEESLYKYETLIENAAAAAKECGEVYRSPFSDMQLTEFSGKLKNNIVSSAKILTEELRHLKEYVKLCFELLGNRVRVLTRKKLNSLFNLCSLLTEKDSPYIKIFNSENLTAQETLNDYVQLFKKSENYNKEYSQNFKTLVDLPAKIEVLKADIENYKNNYRRSKNLKNLWKNLEKHSLIKMNENNFKIYFNQVINIYKTNAEIEKAGEKVAKILGGSGKMSFEAANGLKNKLSILYKTAEELFPEYEYHSFNSACRTIFEEFPSPVFLAFINAYRDFSAAEKTFFKTLNIKSDYSQLDEDYFDFLKMKTAALLDNIDLLPSWCAFNSTYKQLEQEGFNFALEPLLDGKLNSKNLVSCFRKKVYSYFIQTQVADDPLLSKFSASLIEDKIEKFRILGEEFEKLSRKEIKNKLLERLISLDTDGPLSLELVVLSRAIKSGMRGVTLRKLFEEIPTVMQNAAPCMLMSPISVSQYIPPKEQFFDTVIFDEASQMPTSEAVGAIARGKSIIVVGDPKQLPPTTFFSSDYTDEENLENEDLESILEDCLVLGMPEKHLYWHYRSKHESLIAFSNAMYYNNKLLTYPSPDSLESKVTLRYVDGVYDRGETKQNIKEAQSLVEEIVKRLKDNELKKSSIGVVTFSSAQQALIEDMLSSALIKNKLETAAFEREEPVFVKNLENVQGDERDVILFSVGYGPDKFGRLSLNFGPINQAAGWRRLNVAASRARTEMIIFSSMTAGMIDLSRTNSKGVAGLKAFLEFADKGRTMLAVSSKDVEISDKGIGYFIAKELQHLGYECKYDVGVSGFKIDTAVVDPNNKKKFILAIICDGKTAFQSKSARDRTVLQIQTLKKLSWNAHRVWTLNFINNPKREAKKIKDIIDKLAGTKKTASKKAAKVYPKFYREYKAAKLRAETVSAEYLFEPQNEKAIIAKLTALVSVEQPIAKSFLIKRCLASYGIIRSGTRINARMEELVNKLSVKKEILNKTEFFSINDEPSKCEFFRFEGANTIKRSALEFSPYEIIAAVKSVLSEKISLYIPDLIKETAEILGITKFTQDYIDTIKYSIKLGMSKAFLVRSQNDKITLA